jgi:septal ring factor EnvC (AmiA/AmiB activator)
MEPASGGASRALSIAIAILAVLCVASIAVAVVALSKHSQDSKHIRQLESRVRAIAGNTELATTASKLRATETTLATVTSKLGHVDSSMSSVVACIPELQAELNSLEIKGETYALSYITDPTHTSLSCNKLLYPTSG